MDNLVNDLGLTMDEDFVGRIKDAPWYKPRGGFLNITVGGAGGIGSWLSLMLSRMGHKVFLWDDDIIERHNMGGQLYAFEEGRSKVRAVSDMNSKISPHNATGIVGVNHRITENIPIDSVENICFSAFDNMKARKTLLDKWYERLDIRRNKSNINIFIDGRMEAETAIIYAVNSGASLRRYKEELFDDSEVEDKPCSFSATSHNAAIIAGMMCAILNNQISNKVSGQIIREVPYKIEYELPTMTYTAIR